MINLIHKGGGHAMVVRDVQHTTLDHHLDLQDGTLGWMKVFRNYKDVQIYNGTTEVETITKTTYYSTNHWQEEYT